MRPGTATYILALACLGCMLVFLPADVWGRKKRLNVKLEKEVNPNKESSDIQVVSMLSDSLLLRKFEKELRFSGFDKKASSAQESFFLSNGSNRRILGVKLEITYLSVSDQMLHRCMTPMIDCDIPSGETRRLDFKSWDRQKSFYYYKSERPRNSATPFKVLLKLVEIRIDSPDSISGLK